MLMEDSFEAYRDEMLRFLTWYSRDWDEAEDAVQEAFLRAVRARAYLELMPEQALKSWLFTTAKNALTDVKRRNRRLEPIESILEESAGWYEDDDAAERILAEETLKKLPDTLRQIVLMRYHLGYNSGEIGGMLGVPAATVRTRLRSAVSIMKKYITEVDKNE